MKQSSTFSLSNEVKVVIINPLVNQSFTSKKIKCNIEIKYYEKIHSSIPDINHKKIKNVFIDDIDINTWLLQKNKYNENFKREKIIEIIQEFLENVLNYTNKNIIQIINDSKVVL